MAVLDTLECPASFSRSKYWRQILQLLQEEYRTFRLLMYKSVSGAFQYPIAYLLSRQHMWTKTTALLAKSFLVS